MHKSPASVELGHHLNPYGGCVRCGMHRDELGDFPQITCDVAVNAGLLPFLAEDNSHAQRAQRLWRAWEASTGKSRDGLKLGHSINSSGTCTRCGMQQSELVEFYGIRCEVALLAGIIPGQTTPDRTEKLWLAWETSHGKSRPPYAPKAHQMFGGYAFDPAGFNEKTLQSAVEHIRQSRDYVRLKPRADAPEFKPQWPEAFAKTPLRTVTVDARTPHQFEVSELKAALEMQIALRVRAEAALLAMSETNTQDPIEKRVDAVIDDLAKGRVIKPQREALGRAVDRANQDGKVGEQIWRGTGQRVGLISNI